MKQNINDNKIVTKANKSINIRNYMMSPVDIILTVILGVLLSIGLLILPDDLFIFRLLGFV